MSLIFFGCSATQEEEIAGVWLNSQEKCKLHLLNDLTFTSNNIPLDVENSHYIALKKENRDWNGKWKMEKNNIKLTFDNSYYYLKIENPILFGKVKLSMKLLDESGGEIIFLEKQ